MKKHYVVTNTYGGTCVSDRSGYLFHIDSLFKEGNGHHCLYHTGNGYTLDAYDFNLIFTW